MTDHTCTKHEPGTPACYSHCGCRCDHCASAIRADRKRQRHARETGRPSCIPADRIRSHVQALLDSGMGRAEIARRADVEFVTITRLLRGDLATMRRDRATRLALVTPTDVKAQEAGLVDATGSIRRLRALNAIGWSDAEVMRKAGRRPAEAWMMTQSGRCYASTRAAIAAAYDDLWDKTPPRSSGATRAIRRAQLNGWPPPLAWDDDHGPHGIDNPDAQPWAPTAGRVHTIDVIADAAHLGYTAAETAAALGVQRDTVYATCRRYDELDLWERLTRQEAS